MNVTPQHCPKCGQLPEKWIDPKRFKSSLIYWIGCRSCGLLEGGLTHNVTAWNWNRRVLRMRFEKSQGKIDPLVNVKRGLS